MITMKYVIVWWTLYIYVQVGPTDICTLLWYKHTDRRKLGSLAGNFSSLTWHKNLGQYMDYQLKVWQ